LERGPATGQDWGRLENGRVPCLLVLDNIENLKEMVELLPRRGPCHIVVTTRLKAVDNLGRVELDIIGKEDGLQLLSGGLFFDKEGEQHVKQLAERLGYLTLALAVSSRLFTEGRLSPQTLLQRLGKKGSALLSESWRILRSQRIPTWLGCFRPALTCSQGILVQLKQRKSWQNT
jgi:hypothetical protein